MENSFKSIIDQANSILILLPTRPYFDQVAAGLSLYLGLREKKEVAISSPSPITVEFNRLVGVNKISQELGNKNLIIRFTDYNANDIERVSADIEDGQFCLSVIPKPGVSAPQKEQTELAYAGVASDTVILIGGVNESHFPAISSNDLVGAELVHIGTRSLTLSSAKKVISLARPASSVSEIVAGLIKESGLSLEADTATNLLIGIEEGTNKFASPEVTAETFQLAAELMRAGGQWARRAIPQRQTFPPGAIPGRIPPRQPPQKGKAASAPKDWLEPKIYKGTSIR